MKVSVSQKLLDLLRKKQAKPLDKQRAPSRNKSR